MAGELSVGDSNDNLALRMTMMIDYMLRERKNMIDLNKAIEKIVDVKGHFDGKDATWYLKAYKTKM